MKEVISCTRFVIVVYILCLANSLQGYLLLLMNKLDLAHAHIRYIKMPVYLVVTVCYNATVTVLLLKWELVWHRKLLTSHHWTHSWEITMK